MPAYLTADQIADRLDERFGIVVEIFPGDADAASDELDAMSPFVGARRDPEQEREFPRIEILADLASPEPAEIPEPILDWISLRAFQLSTDEAPAVKSEGAGRVSVTYLHGKASQTEKRMGALLSPYLLWTGGVA